MSSPYNSVEPVHPAVREAREAIWEESLQRLERDRERFRAGGRLARAVLLAPNIDVCEALLLGEDVPVKQLDQLWAHRFGRRRSA